MRETLIIIILVFLTVYSCKKENEQFTIPDYKNWKQPVNAVLDTPISGHGESYRLIYANETAFKSKIIKEIDKSRVSMNEGSVIVKEVFEKREDVGYKIPGLFIMIKNSNDPDAINGWVYYMKKPGKDAVEVKWRMCVGCHEAANEKHPYFDGNKNGMFRDYLFTLIAK